MKPTFDADVRLAIANRRLIGVRYNGLDRVAEPHDYGLQKGAVCLLVYQLQSHGAKPSGKGWRLLDAAKVQALVVLDDTFPGSRGQFHDDHFVWDELWCRVR